MKLEFVKINPVENMTVLVKTKINRENYAEVSRYLMEYGNVYCEQVGFIEGQHLQMMGGEFCGNASRSFAAYLAFQDEDFQKEKNYEITCSGYSKTLSVWVRQGEKEHQFLAKIAMPEILSMKKEDIIMGERSISVYRVCLEGITHFILEEKPKTEIVNVFQKYMEKEEYEAFGLMFFEKEKCRMTPYVQVKGISGVWEKSCASGTTALGYYLREKYQMQRANIQQPGGYLEVSLEGEQVFIDGLVKIVAEGEAFL
ncbi:diaminopimelate epimerase [Fusobacterium necrophorum]|uniref:histidine racemase n=1 Tax=Fusobacterium necrophorum TaxID=859 RepID=UPI0010114FC2|nr:diaminopimelate epimerase [Fusobacterium necrophorum]RXZ26216.1 diaminopimelate epimerase [Fusobacterium necrophorum]